MTVRFRFVPLALAVLAATLLPGLSRTGAEAQPQIELIKVDQLNGMLKKGTPAQVIDVRSRQEFLTRHIKGAISIPLDTIELRAGEVNRKGLVVLY